jgi:hypothetical protein
MEEEVWLETENPAGTVISVVLTVYYLPPTPLCSYEGKTMYKYRVLRKNSSILNVSVAWFCGALVLTSSSSASSSTSPFCRPIP